MDCRFQSMCLSRSLNYDNGPIFKLHHYSIKRYSCNLLWCKGCHVSALAYLQLHINDELVEKVHLNAFDFIWHIEWLTKRPKKDTCITLQCLCAGNTTLPSCKLQSTSFPSLVPFFFSLLLPFLLGVVSYYLVPWVFRLFGIYVNVPCLAGHNSLIRAFFLLLFSRLFNIVALLFLTIISTTPLSLYLSSLFLFPTLCV